jgi:hypothetical protein
MRYVPILLVLLALPATASLLGLTSVKQPTYLLGTDSDSIIRIVDVPFVTRWADPEWKFSAICRPFIPATDGSWKDPHDVNLASLYGIVVSGAYKQGTLDMVVTIDASNAKVPPRYPFTVEQVVEAVTTCVKLMHPPRPEEDGKLYINVIPTKTKPNKTQQGKPR